MKSKIDCLTEEISRNQDCLQNAEALLVEAQKRRDDQILKLGFLKRWLAEEKATIVTD